MLTTDAAYHFAGDGLVRVAYGRRSLECIVRELTSTRVFETRTATGSELFSLLTYPYTITFLLLSIFSSLEMSSIKIWKTIWP